MQVTKCVLSGGGAHVRACDLVSDYDRTFITLPPENQFEHSSSNITLVDPMLILVDFGSF